MCGRGFRATAVTPFILFFIAVAAVALRAGFRPGLTAVVLAALVSDFLFIAPRNELTLGWGTAYLAIAYSAGVVGYLVAVGRTAPAPTAPSGLPSPGRNGKS